MLADRRSEDLGEESGAHHRRDAEQRADRALQLALLARSHEPRHQALHGGPREATQAHDRYADEERRPVRRERVHGEPDRSHREADQQRAPLTKPLDRRPHEHALHQSRRDTHRRERSPIAFCVQS